MGSNPRDTLTSRRNQSILACTLVLIILVTLWTLTTSAVPESEARDNDYRLFDEIHYCFPQPQLKKTKDYERLIISGLSNYVETGKPILPFKPVKILLPPDVKKYKVEVIPHSHVKLHTGCLIEPAPTASFFGQEKDQQHRQLNQTIYTSDTEFPGKIYSITSLHKYRENNILLLNLFPVQYMPQIGDVYFYQNLTVKLYVSNEQRTLNLPKQHTVATSNTLLKSLVDNPEYIRQLSAENDQSIVSNATQPSSSSLVNSSDSYEYVLITNQSLFAAFQPLIDTREAEGYNATQIAVEDIYANYSGEDNQSRIRKFIRDCFTNWGTEYILLGGDDEIIPARGVYAEVTNADPPQNVTNMPSDLYYAAIDGTWNYDNDSLYAESTDGAEGGEIDLLADVYLGRAPVDTEEEAQNFVNKTLVYEENMNSCYFNQVLLVGEQLDDSTNGGDSKDIIASNLSSFNLTALYEKDGTFSSTAVKNEINNEQHLVNHVGHGGTSEFMGLTISDVNTLTNDNSSLMYTMACDTAAFDEEKSGETEAIAEHLMCSSAGAFAYIGNTRDGWYFIGNPGDGPSERHDQHFFDALTTKNITRLGPAFEYARQQLVSQVENQSTGVYRWVYLGLTCFGDPALRIKFSPIANFSVTYNGSRSSPETGDTVRLNASQSFDRDGSIVNWTWRYTNETPDYGPVVNHSFSTDGNYTITLTITDNDGIQSTTTQQLTVSSVWQNFTPSTWWNTNQTPSCSVKIKDRDSGLNVSSAQYHFSVDGGITWSNWTNCSCDGNNGTTHLQNITTTTVTFNQDAVANNTIQFRIKNMSGNTLISPIYPVSIDTSAPNSTINPLPSYWNNQSITLEANITESTSGIENITLYFYNSSTNQTWYGPHQFNTATEEPWTWEFNFTKNDGYYRFYTIAIDNASNTEELSSQNDTSCVYDPINPSSLVTNITPHNRSSSFYINVSANDTHSGIHHVSLYYNYSTNNNTNWTRWHLFGENDTAPPYQWRFIPAHGNGYYQFYSRTFDKALNTEPVHQQADTSCFFNDTTPPQIATIHEDIRTNTTLAPHYANISCTVTDNTLVNEININISLPHMNSTNISMTQMGNTSTYYVNNTYSLLGTYTYQIHVTDPSSNHNSSSPHHFNLTLDPSYTPSNPTPANQSTGINRNPTLTWTCTNPHNTTLTYDIYLGTTTPPPLLKRGQNATSYTPPTLAYQTTYYWKIIANYTVLTTQGPSWHYTVKNQPRPPTHYSQPANHQPYQPTLPNGTINATINTTYTYTTTATDPNDDFLYYRFNWGDKNTSEWSPATPSGESTTFSYAWNRQGTYKIKSQVKDSENALSPWSPTLTVTVKSPPATNKQTNTTPSYTSPPKNSTANEEQNTTIDADNDGVPNTLEQTLGSNPTDASDTQTISINNQSYHLIGSDNTSNTTYYHTIYNPSTGAQSPLGRRDNNYLIDLDNDGKWEYIYHPLTGETIPYSKEQQTRQLSPIFIAVLLSLTVTIFVTVLYKWNEKHHTLSNENNRQIHHIKTKRIHHIEAKVDNLISEVFEQ